MGLVEREVWRVDGARGVATDELEFSNEIEAVRARRMGGKSARGVAIGSRCAFGRFREVL